MNLLGKQWRNSFLGAFRSNYLHIVWGKVQKINFFWKESVINEYF